MPSRLTPKGENSRKAIVQAAYELFLEQGYHGTAVRDISRRAGMTTGGVYAHFADKEQIFTAVLKEYHPFWQVPPAMAAAQGDTLEALVHDMARRMVGALGSRRAALNLIFVEIVEFQGRHFTEMFPEYFPVLVEVFGRLAQKEVALRNLPLPLMVRVFFGLFFSYSMTNLAFADQLPFDEASLDGFVDIYLHGILSGGEPSPPPSPDAAPEHGRERRIDG